MPAPRRCRDCPERFTPRRFRPWERLCVGCRAPVSKRGHVTTHRSALFGLWQDPTALAMQASVAGGTRTDPSSLDDEGLYQLRRRNMPTTWEREVDERDRAEEDERARRRTVLLDWAPPNLAALVAALDTEGEMS